MEDEKEELIIEDDEPETIEEPKKEDIQISISRDRIPTYLAIASIVSTFIRVLLCSLFSSMTAIKVIYALFFTASVGAAVGALVVTLVKKKKLEITPDFILTVLATLICFI